MYKLYNKQLIKYTCAVQFSESTEKEYPNFLCHVDFVRQQIIFNDMLIYLNCPHAGYNTKISFRRVAQRAVLQPLPSDRHWTCKKYRTLLDRTPRGAQ